MAAHARGIQAARPVPLPTQRVPDGFQAPEALLNPVAAGIQGGLRLCYRRVGQQHPGLLLTHGVQHTPTGPPGAVQGLVPERPAGAHPQITRSRDQRARWHAWGLARGLKGDVGLVAQAGMPTQRVPEGYNLRPQVAAAQPLVTEHMYRHRGRHGRGQQPQQAAEVVNPGPLCLRTHDVPGDPGTLWVGVLAIDHTDHQGHQVILLGGRIHGQHQRRLLQLPPARGHPPAAHPLQQRGEAALYLQLLIRTLGINAVGIVIQQLPLQAAQRVRVAGTPEAVRQRQRHRILTAVQAQPRALHPQGQHRPQAARQMRQMRCQQVADIEYNAAGRRMATLGCFGVGKVTLSLPARHASA